MEKIISTLNDEFFDFINHNLNSEATALLMKYSGKDLSFDIRFAVLQILARKKTSKKLSSFLSNTKFIFPDSISAEMATDERVASYHAALVGKGKEVVDLTAGLGIDALSFALNGNNVVAVELDPLKAQILRHNSTILGLDDFKTINDNCMDILDGVTAQPDFYYIDPARRDSNSQRTYSLKDCLPDITVFYKKLIEKGAKLLVKASPLLDISSLEKELEGIEAVDIIGVKGEVKEVLITLSAKSEDEFPISAVDIDSNGNVTTFRISSRRSNFPVTYAEKSDITENMILYEPNAEVMKLHAAHELSQRFQGIKKIGPNTELYVSHSELKDFPGRIIRINRILSSKDLKALKGEGLSVVARNYPLSAENLRKKYTLKESTDTFLYAFRVGKAQTPILVMGKREGHSSR